MKASVKNGRAITLKQDKPEKEPAKTPVNAVTSRTKQVNKVVLRDNVLKNVIHAELYKTFREKVKSEYDKVEKNYFSDEWIKFALKDEVGYWNQETGCAIPVQAYYGNKEDLKDNYFGIQRTDYNEDSVKTLFNDTCPYEIMDGIKASKTFEGGHWIGFGSYSYCVEEERYANWNDNDSIQIGVVEISQEDFKKAILSQKYEIGYFFESCEDLLRTGRFRKAVSVIKERSILSTSDKAKCVSEQDIDKLLDILKMDRAVIEKEVTERVMHNFTMTPEIISLYTEGLLACDKVRADLDVYEKKRLEDVNEGHWDLWSDSEPVAKEGQVIATLEKPLVARNPAIDIHEDGLIGIDFGTKSTIVSKQDGREKTNLLRVGTGQLNKKAVSSHYENPTIMEFINLAKFISDYHTRCGRPETSIDDLRVSHTANTDLKSCTRSDDFYSFFYDIKQWCGDTERNIKIIDQKGVERVLPAFVNLEEDAFNPLELYAYYLGLYINNMHKKEIYLDYILSFPVTYEKSVKEKILSSFTKGLKKSLPEPILKNEAIMSKFRVRQGVNEPAAYAITALQGYGFEPDEEENVLYAIFDFGGGTTDFDFGLWRCSDDSKREERRYDYVIEHFGSEGDKYLGGENLLELLAFEVFKANADLLGKKKKAKKAGADEKAEEEGTSGFTFSKPKECDEFPGSETLISDSQEARRNTKQLMEALRPFWEGIVAIADKDAESGSKSEEEKETAAEEADGESEDNQTIVYEGYVFRNDADCKFPIDNGCITVSLFDKDGNRKSDQKLYIENPKENIHVNLVEILEKRIERGVSNFFTSIAKAFRNEAAVKSEVNEIQIFLAGNSSKSPILSKLFQAYIQNEEGGKEYYHLFPPLGTKEAFAIQRERGITVHEEDITAPTGKTGVAYGLIAGREGGKIKVISEIKADAQAKFRYNIGVEKRGKFKMILDRTLVDYGQWVLLTDAGVEDFEIYYTSQPNAAKMAISETGIYKKRCRLPYVDEDADVYIRCVEDSPEELEYCISKDEPNDDAEGTRIHLGE